MTNAGNFSLKKKLGITQILNGHSPWRPIQDPTQAALCQRLKFSPPFYHCFFSASVHTALRISPSILGTWIWKFWNLDALPEASMSAPSFGFVNICLSLSILWNAVCWSLQSVRTCWARGIPGESLWGDGQLPQGMGSALKALAICLHL